MGGDMKTGWNGSARAAIFLLVVVAIAGIQQHCEAGLIPDIPTNQLPRAVVVVINKSTHTVTVATTLQGVLCILALNTQFRFLNIRLPGQITFTRDDGRFMVFPLEPPAPGRRRLRAVTATLPGFSADVFLTNEDGSFTIVKADSSVDQRNMAGIWLTLN